MNKKVKNIAITTFALSALGATVAYLKYRKVMKELDVEEYEEEENLENTITDLGINKKDICRDGNDVLVPIRGKMLKRMKYINVQK